jgi:hypothetical protein
VVPRTEAVSVAAVLAAVEVVVAVAEAAAQQLLRHRHLDGLTDGSC